MIAKSISISVQGCKSGRCAAKAVVSTSGGLERCPGFGTEGVVRLSDRHSEVSRGHSVRWAAHGSGGLKSLWLSDEGSHIQKRG